MKINLNFWNQISPYTSNLPILNPQQKKIAIVATVATAAFVLFTATYMIYRKWTGKKSVQNLLAQPHQNTTPSTNHPTETSLPSNASKQTSLTSQEPTLTTLNQPTETFPALKPKILPKKNSTLSISKKTNSLLIDVKIEQSSNAQDHFVGNKNALRQIYENPSRSEIVQIELGDSLEENSELDQMTLDPIEPKDESKDFIVEQAEIQTEIFQDKDSVKSPDTKIENYSYADIVEKIGKDKPFRAQRIVEIENSALKEEGNFTLIESFNSKPENKKYTLCFTDGKRLLCEEKLLEIGTFKDNSLTNGVRIMPNGTIQKGRFIHETEKDQSKDGLNRLKEGTRTFSMGLKKNRHILKSNKLVEIVKQEGKFQNFDLVDGTETYSDGTKKVIKPKKST